MFIILSRRLVVIIIFFSTFCFNAATLVAQERIETDRPDQTESPFIVPKKYFQFEFGFNVEKDKSNGIKTTSFVHPTTLLKYGVTDNFELRLELEPHTSKSLYNNLKQTSSSLQPVEVGFKISLWEEKGIIPKTSFILHNTIPPFASKEYRHLSAAPNFRFTFQNTITNKLGVGYNAGMEWDGESTIPVYTYTISPGITIGKKWAAYIEAFGFIQKGKVPEHAIDGGLYFFPDNNIKLDVSAGYGLTEVTNDFYIALGISFRFKG